MKLLNRICKTITFIGIITFTSIMCMAEQEHNEAWEIINGTTGSLPQYGVGWLDLDNITDFKEGDKLRLRIGGEAKRVLVRLLPKTSFPDSSDGVVGRAIDVQENRIVVVVLKSDRSAIKQVSVHGGSNPWGKYSLGESNGNATLEEVQLTRKKKLKK
ncbi:MAG: hypothetical protein GY797_04590 [Deltaproteobacteria bacterium]|nr:hypothetical protein [Deltaproteobacteria bacterium]